MTRTAGLVPATMLLGALLLAACAGRTDAASAPGASAATGSEADAWLAFAQCMRDAGIDYQDPEIHQGDDGVSVSITGQFDPLDERFVAADERCRAEHLDGVIADHGPVSAEERAEQEEAMLAFARCMREHGVPMPDPVFSDGGMHFEVGDPEDGELPSAAEMEAAEQACGGEDLPSIIVMRPAPEDG